MILRRLREHVRQENWLAVILELVVVIVGLFLAFQLDRWYETQRIKSDQHVHLGSLAEDFTENEARLTSAINRAELKMAAAITLRGEIRKNSPDLSVTELSQLVAQTTFLPTYHAVDVTYRNLISGGALVNLPNSELRTELAEFYAAYELTKLIQNTNELQYVTIWQQYALNSLDYAAVTRVANGGRQYTALQPYLDPELILSAMKTKQFENVIVIQWESAEDLVNNWSKLLERSMRIQAIISAQN